MSLTSRAGKDAGRYRRRVVRSPRGVEIRKRFISWDLMALLMWFESGQVRPLFRAGYIAPVGNPYDAAADGERFVFTTLPESPSTPLVLVTNWTADIKK